MLLAAIFYYIILAQLFAMFAGRFAAALLSSDVVRLYACRSLPQKQLRGHTLTFHQVAYSVMQCTKTIAKKRSRLDQFSSVC